MHFIFIFLFDEESFFLDYDDFKKILHRSKSHFYPNYDGTFFVQRRKMTDLNSRSNLDQKFRCH